MTEKCVECGLDYPKPMHETEKGLLCDICFKSEQVWDRWRRNEISHEQVQEELDEILGPEPEGFFKTLKDTLGMMVSHRISIQARQKLSAEGYFNKRKSIRQDIIENSNWLAFWQSRDVASPSEEDVKTVAHLSDRGLADYYLLIMETLKQFVDADLETSDLAEKLHQYQLLLKQEINSRSTMPKLSEQDGFLDWIQNKQAHKKHEHQIADARVTGEICIHCGSKNVGSNGNMWTCRDCKRSFRKH